MLAQRIDTIVDECLAKLQPHFPNQELKKPHITYNLRGHTAGQAQGGLYTKLNLELLNDPRYQDDMLHNTLPHEIAHNVVRQVYPRTEAKSHGYQWQRVMRLLGLEPTRCHDYETKPARKRKPTERPHKYYCNCPEPHMVTALIHKRMQQGHVYKCRVCNTWLETAPL